VAWAFAWAPIAIVVGTQIIDPDNSMDEMWVMIGALPGFLSAVVFSIVRGFAERQRRLDELSTPRVAVLGAVSGALVGLLPFLLGSMDDPSLIIPGIIGSIALMSTLSALVSAAFARSRQRESAVRVDP
jgi:H+/Cl- antiporter ClcA